MCKGHLGDFGRKARCLGRPITEGASKTVWNRFESTAGARGIAADIPPSRLPVRVLGKTRSESAESSIARLMIDTATSGSGTLCWRIAFVRSAGIVHTRVSRSVSDLRAPRTSPVRVAVRIRSRRAGGKSHCQNPLRQGVQRTRAPRHMASRHDAWASPSDLATLSQEQHRLDFLQTDNRRLSPRRRPL